MSDLKFIIKIIFFTSMLISTKCQGDYGQTGNSQIGANPTGTTNTNTNIYTDTNTINVNSNNCYESDPFNICVTKPNCCHVTNSYGSFTYSACVDAKSRNLFSQFCVNFFEINAKQGFYSQECRCYGDFNYVISAKYIENSFSIIIMIFVTLLI